VGTAVDAAVLLRRSADGAQLGAFDRAGDSPKHRLERLRPHEWRRMHRTRFGRGLEWRREGNRVPEDDLTAVGVNDDPRQALRTAVESSVEHPDFQGPDPEAGAYWIEVLGAVVFFITFSSSAHSGGLTPSRCRVKKSNRL
jgi:hypothetical protein